MFKYRGEKRTAKHNLQIASLLSFVAGIVNVAGFLAIQRLTTNVTGHFAHFMSDVYNLNFAQGILYFLYIFSFLLGSFVASFLIEFFTKKKVKNTYIYPVLLESTILFIVAIFHQQLLGHPNLIAFLLLFAMGLQNSLVTTISSAVVRTTHLTGLFTDLGIELSQLFFYRQQSHRARLLSSIYLRLTIICFFFLGGIFGAYFYTVIGLYVLIIAGVILWFELIVDTMKLKLAMVKQRLT